nr:MAG TPA: hypothetical protein [Caudoviricetes sp.]
MLFNVKMEHGNYQGQFLEVLERSDDRECVYLAQTDGENAPKALVRLDISSWEEAMILASTMKIPVKFRNL